MKEKKHIDRLFQERFKDFEAQPDSTVWDNIEAKLNEKKKKRRVIPIWWRYAGVAALLVLLLTIGTFLFNDDSTQQITPQIVDTEKTDGENTIDETHQNSSNNDKNNVIASDKIDSETHDVTKATKENNTQPAPNQVDEINKNIVPKEQSSSVANTNKENIRKTFKTSSKDNNPAIITYKDHIPKTEVANNENSEKTLETKNTVSNKTAGKTITDNSISDKTNTSIASNKANTDTQDKTSVSIEENAVTKVAENNTKEEKQSIEDAIEQNKSLLEEEKTEVATLNKWSIAPNVAPVYFSSLGKGSTIGADFNENSKSGEVNMSYGINASYAINKRLTVRSGVNRVNLGYNTNDVVVFSSVNASASTKTLHTLSSNVADNMAETATISAGDNVAIMSATAFKSSNIAALETTNTSINQSFGFIEVPLELQYALSTKRLGINVIGGFSSLFLNNYESTSIVEGQRTRLQEADNINNTSYSANFGLGVNYKVTEKINLNLEPMFKYQINTFKNTSGDFQPFFIGVYTGFGIKF